MNNKEYLINILNNCVITEDNNRRYFISSSRIVRQKKLCRITGEPFIFNEDYTDSNTVLKVLDIQKLIFLDFNIQFELVNNYKMLFNDIPKLIDDIKHLYNLTDYSYANV